MILSASWRSLGNCLRFFFLTIDIASLYFGLFLPPALVLLLCSLSILQKSPKGEVHLLRLGVNDKSGELP